MSRIHRGMRIAKIEGDTVCKSDVSSVSRDLHVPRDLHKEVKYR